MIAHSNHAAAAVMIVNPTTPSAVTGNMTQQLNVSRGIGNCKSKFIYFLEDINFYKNFR